LGIASQLQALLAKLEAAPEKGTAPQTTDWPIVQRVLSQLSALREHTKTVTDLLFALAHDRTRVRAVAKSGAGTWRDVAIALIQETRAQIRRQQCSALEGVLAGLDCQVFLLERESPGNVSLMSDLVLLVPEGDHLQATLERVIALPDELARSIHFRTYVMPAIAGVAIPQLTQMLGSRDGNAALWPATSEDVTALAIEVGLDYLQAPLLDEAARAMALVVQASFSAAAYRLRDPRFSRDRELAAATEALGVARGAVERIAVPAVRQHLDSALALVALEIDGPREQSLAAQAIRSAIEGKGTPWAALSQAMTLSALEVELQSQCAPAAEP
jgi:hypothetical protein